MDPHSNGLLCLNWINTGVGRMASEGPTFLLLRNLALNNFKPSQL
jgi:hypothetical protein